MGRLSHTPIEANSDPQTPRKRRKGSSHTPSANALRERVRAQNMKRAYLKLQKTLPQVPPDTKLPRLNILLLAIDYISHLRCVLRSGKQPERGLHNLQDRSGMLRPFIEVRLVRWPGKILLLKVGNILAKLQRWTEVIFQTALEHNNVNVRYQSVSGLKKHLGNNCENEVLNSDHNITVYIASQSAGSYKQSFTHFGRRF